MTPERYQRIGQLFDEALARAPTERASWLEQACGADAGLRDEVEKLLDNHDESKDFLSLPALRVAAALISRNQQASVAEKQPGHYQILSLLGAGSIFVARSSPPSHGLRRWRPGMDWNG